MTATATQTYLPGVLPLKIESGRILLVDQRKLPGEFCYFDATEHKAMLFAIKDMVVRGAPSIGVAAAFGLAFEVARLAEQYIGSEFITRFDTAKDELNATRPTAVNLRWALERMNSAVKTFMSGGSEGAVLAKQALDEAENILQEHLAANLSISKSGAAIVPDNARIITHCNAGGLATCGYGTALGVIRGAHFDGKNVSVYVDETRPRNQGSKLTMWELHQDKVPCTLICDSMSGHLMMHNKVDMVITGADRIARNGDTANKIGTYNLAVLAYHHKVPFYIAAPLSTFDFELADGKNIPIEERDPAEVITVGGVIATVEGARAFNPSFDVTPGELIAGIITEAGILRPDYKTSIGNIASTAALSNKVR